MDTSARLHRLRLCLMAGVLMAAALWTGCQSTTTMRTADPASQEEIGQQVAMHKGTTPAPFGYFQYLPSASSDRRRPLPLPLLVFLHGAGERGNGTTELDIVTRNGPPRMLAEGSWPDDLPFIVLSPQLDTTYRYWPVEKIDAFINYAVEHYFVDTDRIYLTGLSLGGHGTWTYAATYPDRIAAAAPVCGDGRLIEIFGSYCDLAGVPVWAFHGAEDPIVDPVGSIVPVRQMKACPDLAPVPMLTMFPGVGHDSWALVYDGSGRDATQDPSYTRYDQDLYRWMLRFTR